MPEYKGFQERVRELYKASTPYDGRRPTQKDLAEAIGLHPVELSDRFSGRRGARLTAQNIRAIIRQLAAWGAIQTQAEALDLLEMTACPPFKAGEWQAPPLDLLTRLELSPSRPSPATSNAVRTVVPNPRHNLPRELSS